MKALIIAIAIICLFIYLSAISFRPPAGGLTGKAIGAAYVFGEFSDRGE